MFVQFGEKLRSKRLNLKDLKNTLFGLLKAKIECQDCLQRKKTSVIFVQFVENLYIKHFEQNDLKTCYLDSSKRKNNVMNRKTSLLRVCKIWGKLT